MPENNLPLAGPYQSIEDVMAGLSMLEQAFVERRDRRGVFVSAYIQITGELIQRIGDGRFDDDEWLSSYVVAFAELYRHALATYEQGDLEAVPKPWRAAFDAALDGSSVIIQDLILGINAHINHDLPLALLRVSIDPDRPSRYRDHTSVNDALQAATNIVQERLSEIYAPALGFLDLAGGEADEVLTNFSFAKARDNAWMFGTVLVDAAGEEETESIRQRLNDQAAVLSRLILRPNKKYPWLFSALHQLDDALPEWRTPFLKGGGVVLPAGSLAEEPVVHSFDEVIARLQTLIAHFDEQHSRLSIYPTIYIKVTQGIKKAVADGHFEDPAWLERLDLLFASQYFRIIEHFQAGRLDQIPLCWRTALEAAAGGETVVLQDIVLAINARLNHDLGIALFQAGIAEEDTERRIRDYKRIHDIFAASINDVQDILAGKYSAVLGFLDMIAGALDELVVDFLYTQARDTALDNAFALANSSSEEEARRLIAGIDRQATDIAQTLLLRRLVMGGWIISALRQVEDSFQGLWSRWLIQGTGLTLYQRVLGDNFDRLPPVLHAFHGQRYGGRAGGVVAVTRRRGALHNLVGRLLRLPPAGPEVPISLQVVVKGREEQWFRVFGGDPAVALDAVQSEASGLLEESFGPLRLGFQLQVEGQALIFKLARCRLGPLSLPRFLAPRTGAKLEAGLDDWHIDVYLELPMLGQVLRYKGRVAAG